MYCSKCGKPLPDDSLFCPFCGENLTRTKADNAQQPVSKPIADNAPSTIQDVQDIPCSDVSEENILPERDIESDMPQSGSVPQDVENGSPAKECPPTAPSELADDATDVREEAPEPTAPLRQRKRINKKKLLIFGGIALVVLLAAILIPVGIHNAKQTKYNEGASLLESGEYGEAYKVFSMLDDFDDSVDMAAYCQKGMRYRDAVTLMEEESFSEAKEGFDAISGFKDASELSKQCSQALDYEEAMSLYEEGDYAAAAAAFASAGEYRNAQKYVAECNTYVDYDRAKQLMETGEYDEAKALLAPLDSAVFTDKDALVTECENMPLYLEAKTALENDKRYTAYSLFSSLGDFKDSATLASSCKVSKPSTGEIYRNSAYKGSACSLTIKPPTGDGSSTYIKIYSSDGALVSCVFINAGDKSKVNLPAGSYRLKAAYGFGEWFGEEDMFGDDGVYQLLKVSSNNEIFDLKKNYDYTLTLRSASGDTGDSVSTSNENREDF